MACEYGPIGFGPRSVITTFFIECSPLRYEVVQMPRNFRNERESLRARRDASSKAHEFRNILVRFLFECGDKIIQVEAAAAACVKHVAECSAEDLETITILQAIKK